MIRTVPDDGIIAYNLTSNDTKPTEHLKTGSVIFEVDTQDKYFFDEESKQWYKYTGPWLNFYTKINEETYCFFGLAKDTKPEGFGIGSMFVEVDASKAYILSDDGWKEAEEPGPTPPGPTPKPTLQDKTVDPTTNAQQVTYDSGYDGLGTVNITAVTNTIDNNIKAENIKKDIAILGVLGTYEPVIPTPSLQDKTVAPKTTEQIVHADEAYDGLNIVTVSAVTSSIDNHIQAANIKKNVTILGVVGTYEGEEPQPVPTTTVDAVILLIDNLPTPASVVEDNRARIHSVRETYEALLPAEQASVTNYSKLEACEAALPDEIIDLDFTDPTVISKYKITDDTHIIFHDPYYDILVHCDAIAGIDDERGLKYNSNHYFEVFNSSKKTFNLTFTFVSNNNTSEHYFSYGDDDTGKIAFGTTPVTLDIVLESGKHIQFTAHNSGSGGAYLSKLYCII